MKTVVTNPYHLWAHEVQDFARNGSSNRSFRGKDAYSYSTVIATIARNAKGVRAFLVSTRSYSVTTAKHYSEIRYAIRDQGIVFNVKYLSTNAADLKSQVTDYLERIQASALTAKRARVRKEYAEADTARLILELREYVKFFGLKGVKIPDDAGIDALADSLAKIQVKERKEEREAAARARKDAQEAIDKWTAGENVHIPYSVTEAFMRVKGENVETSRGADVPLEHVTRALPIVLRMIRAGGTYSRYHAEQTFRLGYYTLDSIDAQGNVRVGCHYFTRAEVERFAGVLKAATIPTA